LQTWEVIQEDKDGLIEFSVQDMLERAKRKRLLEKSGAKIKLGMMRHLYIILDLSDAMKLQVGQMINDKR
jgi:transcription initiation factor TFIIH subunit 2